MIKIWNNIGYKEINELLSAQRKFISDNTLTIILRKENDFYGEIDQVFLSYVVLFLRKYRQLRLEVRFTEPIDESGRFFSFAVQVQHLKHLYKVIDNENFKVEGSYIDKDSGEILELKNYNELGQSSSYIPPILIYQSLGTTKNSIVSFFHNKNNKNDKLTSLYRNKLISEVKGVVESSTIKFDQKKFVSNFDSRLNKFSFIKLCLLRVLIEKKSGIFLRKGSRENTSLIQNLESFCDNILTGLEELAKNVIEHSSEKEGVITIRKFPKKVLESLKSEDESKYLNLGSNEDIKYLLDINIIDLGIVDIKEKYIQNLKSSKTEFISELAKEKPKLLELVKDSIGISYDDDIEIISQKDYSFYKLFIKESSENNEDLKGINYLSVQKNKFISKIGLQYFTTIVKDNYQGFVKVSSKNEKAIIYKNRDELEFEIIDRESFIHYGTFYSCIIPIRDWKVKASDYFSSSDEHTFSQDPNTFNEITNYNYIDDLKNYIEYEKNIIEYEINLSEELQGSKYNLFNKLFLDIHKLQLENNLNFSKENDIIAISCKEIEKEQITNASHWLRFIWTLDGFFENIILYDLDLHHFESIIALRRAFYDIKTHQLWDDNSRVLFYSRKTKESDKEYYRYGANLLAGKDKAEFDILNTKIWKHHYSFKGKRLFELNYSISTSKHLDSVLFSKGNNLHYYEVLLSTETVNENRISLFEKSAQYSLNTPLEKKQTEYTNNKGYKINNTHFRLGSKIHISNFYYAKKLFQNSFFTIPLAYKIADNIWNGYFYESNMLISDNEENSFTIVGYENYSSFLISSIRNFLEKRIEKFDYRTININHLTIDKDGQLSRERNKICDSGKVIIIVPIASTFNTSLKIEDQLNGIVGRANKDGVLKIEKVQVIEPIQNVVLVAHRQKDESKFLEDFMNEKNEFVEDTIYKDYNWHSADLPNKTIAIERYNFTEDSKFRKQKYLIPVYTDWEEAKGCRLCYPTENPYSEKCLIETGQASITPQVIFGFPRTKKYNSFVNQAAPVLSLEGSLLYGSLKNRDNKYLYFNRTGKIIEDNIEEIKEWIINLKSKIRTNKTLNSHFFSNKVVIITPNTGSRSRFLDLINEFLFEYTANCVIISLKEDYIENAETLYSDGLHNAQTIVYVDDVLSTAKSFLDANYIIKYIRNKNYTGEGIHYCISLINRMAYADEENLLLKLKPLKDINKTEEIPLKNRLIYYYKLNNPTIEEANKTFPLNLERKKYNFLEKTSALDEIRKYFYKKQESIKSYNLEKSPPSIIKDYSLDFNRGEKRRNKKLFQLLVLNAIYSLFYYDSENFVFPDTNDLEERKSGYEKSRIDVLQKYFPKLRNNFSLLHAEDKILIESSFNSLKVAVWQILKNDDKHNHFILDNRNNLEYVILKVICSTPLIYYKQIRESSFYWILIMLEFKLERIGKLKSPMDFYLINRDSNYNFYQDLKFLLKRSVKLRSNFLIHKKTLFFLENLINKLRDITESDLKNIKAANLKVKNALQAMLQNKNYLNVPSIKLKLYDFVQNCLKDGIFTEISFDRKIVTKTGLNLVTQPISRQKEHGYHKTLIRNYKSYTKDIPSKNISLFLQEDKAFVQPKDEIILKEFESEFEKLIILPRYKVSSPKNLIVHLVALVQELVYQHETKSIRLDNVIGEIQSESSYNINCNENGSFIHLIRLLHLENIEIINKYSKELISKYKNKINTEIDISSEVKNDVLNKHLTINFAPRNIINRVLSKDKKYEELCYMQREAYDSTTSIDSYISLKKYLRDLVSEDKGKEDKIQDKILVILTKIKNIIGPGLIDDIFFTINYKDFEIYRKQDLYTFSDSDSSSDRIELLERETSLTSLMGNGAFKTDDGNIFSHFEVMKKDDIPVCRDIDLVKRKIISSEQFSQLENDKSILLIRLSDFLKEIENSFDKYFRTLGVITIYLNEAKRVDEKKLRLLLALRQDLNRFVKKKTLGTTFLELITSQEQKDFIFNSTHYIQKYFTLLISLNKQIRRGKGDLRTEREFTFTIDAIKQQLLLLDRINDNDSTSIDLKDLIDRIQIVFLSGMAESALPLNSFNFSRKGLEDSDVIIKQRQIWDIVIIQLLINIKQYSVNASDSVHIHFSKRAKFFKIVFKNVIDSRIEPKHKGRGIDFVFETISIINSKLNTNFSLSIYQRIYDNQLIYFSYLKIPK